MIFHFELPLSGVVFARSEDGMQQTKKRAAGILAALKNMILKWSGKRHLEIRLLYTICCKIGILNSKRFGKL